jgi:hypothetical protein
LLYWNRCQRGYEKLQGSFLKPKREHAKPEECENQSPPKFSLKINEGACPNGCGGPRQNPLKLKKKEKPALDGYKPEFEKRPVPPLVPKQSSLSEGIKELRSKENTSPFWEGRPQPRLIADLADSRPQSIGHGQGRGPRRQRQFNGPNPIIMLDGREKEPEVKGNIAQFRPIMALERLQRSLTRDEESREEQRLPKPPTHRQGDADKGKSKTPFADMGFWNPWGPPRFHEQDPRLQRQPESPKKSPKTSPKHRPRRVHFAE